MPNDEDDERVGRVCRELDDRLNRSEFDAGDQAKGHWAIFNDPKEAWGRRSLAIAALLYFVIPLDFMPDFLLGGLVDDLAVIVTVYLALTSGES